MEKFISVSSARWKAFSNMHLKHYDGDKRNYSECEGIERLFLRTDIKREDGNADFVAVSMENLETGVMTYTIRKDIVDGWNAVCEKMGM